MDNMYNDDFYFDNFYIDSFYTVQKIPKRYIRDMQNPIEFLNDTQFFDRFRFPKCIVLEILLPIVLKNINPVTDLRGLPISPIMKLLTALRFYASGCYQRVNGDIYGISQPSISRIVKEISTALCHSLQTWVKFPSIESIPEIKNQFYQIAQFPGVTMVMDCTHIPISSPGGEKAEFYRNRKGWMSLNVQLIAGPKLQIFDVVARWPGSAHDSRIFENSKAWNIINQGFNNGKCLADGGYAQTRFVYTPHPNPQTAAEKKYQKSHIKTRNVIERVNGLLKSRFRCLQRKLGTQLQTSTRIIIACVILHNICIHYKFNNIIEDNFSENLQTPMAMTQVNSNDIRGSLIREEFIAGNFS